MYMHNNQWHRVTAHLLLNILLLLSSSSSSGRKAQMGIALISSLYQTKTIIWEKRNRE